MGAGTICLRVRGSVDAGLPPVEVLELCDSGGHVVSGRAVILVYVGRPETDQVRGMAMNLLGLGLEAADHDEDALSVKETELSMRRRLGAPETVILAAQGNLASTYRSLGRLEEALLLRQEIYSVRLKLNGREHDATLRAAFNYANILNAMRRHAEAKALMRKTIPVGRRVLGASHDLTLKMRWLYAESIWRDPATLDDLREAVTTLEDTDRIARRVLGAAHPTAVRIEQALRAVRQRHEARK